MQRAISNLHNRLEKLFREKYSHLAARFSHSHHNITLSLTSPQIEKEKTTTNSPVEYRPPQLHKSSEMPYSDRVPASASQIPFSTAIEESNEILGAILKQLNDGPVSARASILQSQDIVAPSTSGAISPSLQNKPATTDDVCVMSGKNHDTSRMTPPTVTEAITHMLTAFHSAGPLKAQFLFGVLAHAVRNHSSTIIIEDWECDCCRRGDNDGDYAWDCCNDVASLVLMFASPIAYPAVKEKEKEKDKGGVDGDGIEHDPDMKLKQSEQSRASGTETETESGTLTALNFYYKSSFARAASLTTARATPASDLPTLYAIAKHKALTLNQTTIIGVDVMDLHHIDVCGTPEDRFNTFVHMFVLGVAPEGMVVWQAWRGYGDGYDIGAYLRRGGARVRGWEEADDFVGVFGRFVVNEGTWNHDKNTHYKHCFEIDINANCAISKRPMPATFECRVVAHVIEDVRVGDVLKFRWRM